MFRWDWHRFPLVLMAVKRQEMRDDGMQQRAPAGLQMGMLQIHAQHLNPLRSSGHPTETKEGFKRHKPQIKCLVVLFRTQAGPRLGSGSVADGKCSGTSSPQVCWQKVSALVPPERRSLAAPPRDGRHLCWGVLMKHVFRRLLLLPGFVTAEQQFSQKEGVWPGGGPRLGIPSFHVSPTHSCLWCQRPQR